MQALKRLLHPANIEAGIAVLSFGASSAFWLLLAFLMSGQAYGTLMTAQAAVMLVVTALTFRTHDLFFNIVTQRGLLPAAAYRAARLSEVLASLAAAVVVLSGAALYFLSRGDPASLAVVAAYGVMAIVGAAQGAAIARLRNSHRGDIIAGSDAATAMLWLVAAGTAIGVGQTAGFTLLALGAIPPFVRSVLLTLAVRRMDAEPMATQRWSRKQAGEMGHYLLGAQVTNFLKNGAVSIETMILAAFAPAPMIAMYRVARAVLGIGVAALNVAYQRTYPALAGAATPEAFRDAVRSLERRSLAIASLAYPVCAAVVFVYAWLKPDIEMVPIQILTFGTFVASLPAALQQGAFAVLSLRGDHRSANFAYVLWFCALGAGCAILLIVPDIGVFMAALIFAGVFRLWYLRRCARADPPAPADTRDPKFPAEDAPIPVQAD